jgi:hypothetical protein
VALGVALKQLCVFLQVLLQNCVLIHGYHGLFLCLVIYLDPVLTYKHVDHVLIPEPQSVSEYVRIGKHDLLLRVFLILPLSG